MTGSRARAWLLDAIIATVAASAAVVLTTELTAAAPTSARVILEHWRSCTAAC